MLSIAEVEYVAAIHIAKQVLLTLKLLQGAWYSTTDLLNYFLQQSDHHHDCPLVLCLYKIYWHCPLFLIQSHWIQNTQYHLCTVTQKLSRPIYKGIGGGFTFQTNLQNWSNAQGRGSVKNREYNCSSAMYTLNTVRKSTVLKHYEDFLLTHRISIHRYHC